MDRYYKGQILAFKYDNPTSNIISCYMGHYYTHVGIVTKVRNNEVMIQEAMGTFRLEKYKQKGLFSKIRFFLKTRKLFGGQVSTNTYTIEFLDSLYDGCRLKVMDFRVPTNSKFDDLISKYEGIPYDYLSVFNLAVRKISLLFNRSERSIENTAKRMFCSEHCMRILVLLKGLNMLEQLNKTDAEQVTPQDISNLFDKIKYR